jgi:hypothetical protein
MAGLVVAKVQHQKLYVKTSKNTMCLLHVMLVFMFCLHLHCFLFLLFSFLANYHSSVVICHVLFAFAPIGGVLVVLLFI